MSLIEYIAGGLLMISCIFIIVIVTIQQPKGNGISGAIMGGDTQVQQGRRGKSNDAKLARVTKFLAIIFFVVTLVVDIIVLLTK